MADQISVEVVYALPLKQELFSLKLQEGATIGQAIERSGILEKYPEIDLSKKQARRFCQIGET